MTMLRKTISLLAIALLIASCSSNTAEKAADPGQTIEANISDLLADPLAYDSKNVQIEGVITHVCRHSGDKMRIMQDGSDLTIQVMLGDFTGQFDTESEGMRVSVTGTMVTEVTNLDELQAHSHEGEEHDCEDTRQAVEAMKAKGLDANIRSHIALNHYEAK